MNALTNGKMAVQGATLTTGERVAVAQFVTGRDVRGFDAALEPVHGARRPPRDPMQGPRWMAWGGDATNTRYAAQGGLTAQDLPRLKLKWAFAYDGRHVGARPAGARRRQALRRQRQRRAARARSEDRLHLLDVQGRARHSQRAQRVAVSQRQRHALRGVLRRSEGQRLCGRRGDGAAGVEAQSRRASERGDHRRHRGRRRQGVRADSGARRGDDARAAATTSAARSAATSPRSTSTPARCSGRPTPWTSRSCAARTRGTAPTRSAPPAAASGRRRRSIWRGAPSTSRPATATPIRCSR